MRTQEIKPPSARAETWAVARAAFHIVYWSAILISGQAYTSPRAALAAASPLERSFSTLDAPDQRLYRALREGMTEAEAIRSESGAWPTASVLATKGIPPFAADPIDRAHYTWTSTANKTVANYLGRPAPASGRPAFLVIITEPDPGTPADPTAVVDDVHHRLSDGTIIHVMVWTGPDLGPMLEPVAVANLEQGFRQIVVRE